MQKLGVGGFLLLLYACHPQPPGGNDSPASSPAVRAAESGAKADTAPARGAVRLFTGRRQTCLASASGTATCWGYNGSGQLLAAPATNVACGAGGGNRCRSAPEKVDALRGVRDLSFGEEHACSIDRNGVLGCWGDASFLVANEDGTEPCGAGHRCRSAPSTIDVADAEEIATGVDTTCARTKNGEVWCWGWNDLGQIGDGTRTGVACMGGSQKCRLGPTRVAGLSHATQLAMGARHSCARLADGTVRCWGQSDLGQLGDATIGDRCDKSFCRPAASQVAGLYHVVQIAVGDAHACAVREDGSVKCWGSNENGRLGDGAAEGARCGADASGRCRLAPVSAVGLNKIVEVAVGSDFSCARSSEGKVLCWGAIHLGPNSPPSASPKAVDGLADAVALRAGESHVCALRRNGTLACWGRNAFGQLGDGTTDARVSLSTPKL